MQHRSREITVSMPTAVALYIFNHQRTVLADVESKYQFSVTLKTDDTLIPPDFRIERIKVDSGRVTHTKANTVESKKAVDEGGERRQPRLGRRLGRDKEGIKATGEATKKTGDVKATNEDTTAVKASRKNSESTEESTEEKAQGRGKRRRRGRRGGRRYGRSKAGGQLPAESTDDPVKAVVVESANGIPEDVRPMGGPETSPQLASPAGEDADRIPKPNASDEAAAKKQPKRRQRANSVATKDEIAKTTAQKPAQQAHTRKTKKTDPAEKKIVLGAEVTESDETAVIETAKPTPRKTPREPRRKATPKKKIAADTKPDVIIPAGESPTAPPPPGRPPLVPVEPAVAASPNHISGKTEVIKVGAESSQDQPAGKSPPRKGWWSRTSE